MLDCYFCYQGQLLWVAGSFFGLTTDEHQLEVFYSDVPSCASGLYRHRELEEPCAECWRRTLLNMQGAHLKGFSGGLSAEVTKYSCSGRQLSIFS